MNQNTRFYGLVACVLVVVAGLYYFVRGGGTPAKDKAVATTPKAEPSHGRDNLEAPEITSGRRESRLSVTSGRSTSIDDEPKRGPLVGDAAIRGEVTLEDDNLPMEGVEITIYRWNRDDLVAEFNEDAAWKTSTNARGLYRVDKLPEGRYAVFARKDDLGGVGSAFIRPLLREPDDHVADIQLAPVGTIAGSVIDEQQQPINGALIALGRGKIGERDIYGGENQTKSAADGAFTLAYVREGEWTIEAKAEGFAVAELRQVPTDGQPVQIILKKGGSVSGTVITAETSKPAPNIEISMRGPGRLNAAKVKTDNDGKFSVENLADGSYALSIDKQPYILTGQAPPITIADANSVKDLQLTVAMGGTISGRATDAVTGAPIANLGFRPMLDGRGRMNIEAGTDEDGYYRIEGLPAGSYKVRRMWMAGYRHGEDREDKSATVALGQEVSGIDFAVPPGLYLRGKVVDRDGEPLASVMVTSEDANNQEGETTQTDDKGRFAHRGFSPGTVISIRAEKAGYSATPIQNLTFPEADKNDVEIIMDTGASVAGTVVDKTGNPLPNIYVVANPTEGTQGDSREGYSREDGSFKVQGLAEGKYKLTARPPRSWRNRTDGGTEVQVATGEHKTGVRVTADFDAGLKLAGRVVDSSNNPVRDANVNVHMRSGGANGYSQTDPDGKFEITGLETGVYDLYVHHNQFAQYRQEQVNVPNPNLTITLRGKGTISGRVLDARSGQPVKTFSVAALQGEVGRIDPGYGIGGGGQTFVDDEGKFEIRADSTDDGKTSLYVQGQGYAPKVQLVTGVDEGQTKSGVEVRLVAGAGVAGKVTNKQGEPVAGASIWVGRMPQQWERGQRSANATTDADGTYQIDSLGTDAIHLYAMSEGYATATAQATPSSGNTTTVNFVLGSGGTITGTVRVGGKPAPGGYGVNIYFAQEDGMGYNASTNVDNSGAYSFKGLPEGEANLNVYGNRGDGSTNRQIQKTATVSPDKVTTVDFDIVDGTASVEGTVTRDGQPVADAYVNVGVRVDEGNYEHANARTDANGAFKMTGLPVGEASLTVHIPNDNQSRSFQVTLEDRQTVRKDIELNSGIRVSGKVNGAPENWHTQVAVFRGSVQVPENIQTMWTSMRDLYVGGAQANSGDGAFQIEGLEAGEYTIIAIAMDPTSGGQTTRNASQSLTIEEGAAPNIELTLK